MSDENIALLRELYASWGRGDFAVFDLFTFRAGKIVRYESYWDRAEAFRAAGLEP